MTFNYFHPLTKIGKIANEKKRTNKRAREIRKEERRVGEKGKPGAAHRPLLQQILKSFSVYRFPSNRLHRDLVSRSLSHCVLCGD